MNSLCTAMHLEGNPWNIKGHIADERSPRDTCNEEQQVVTTPKICTCQTEVDTCDRYILISTCLVQNQTCSQQHGSQMSSASPLSMATARNPGWKRHLDLPLKCTPCRRARPGEGPVRPCPAVGARSHACCPSCSQCFPFQHLLDLALFMGEVDAEAAGETARVSLFLLFQGTFKERKEDGWIISEQAGNLLTN